VLPGEIHGRDDVADLLGLQHRQRPFVEHAVVDRARLVVILVIRGDHPTAHLLTQGPDSPASQGLHIDICHCLTPLKLPADNSAGRLRRADGQSGDQAENPAPFQPLACWPAGSVAAMRY
jgi:hypothetical protein